MRAIFLLLLVGNLVFFGYHYFFVVKNEPVDSVRIQAGKPPEQGELQLLTEQADTSKLRVRVKDETKGRAPSDDDVKDAEFCTMIGPYGQLLQAEYAVEQLVALGAVAQITPVEIKEGESYWVYLQPEVSEKEALRRLYELQKKNVECHIITKGELTNGISFGRFANYDAAEARMVEIERQGYEVNIKKVPKTIQEIWVVVDAGFAEKIDETVWVSLLNKESTLEKRQNFCLGVASRQMFH